jgi:hypothetical protein
MQTVDNQSNNTEQPLSEAAIKKAFIPFLRNFYKDRYAIQFGSLNTSFDNVSESGIVADGKLTFLKQNESDPSLNDTFTCTYEATSVDKIGEVKFGINQSYFLWDCAAFTALVVAVLYVLTFVSRSTFLYFLGTIGNIGFLLGVSMIAFSTWFFTMRSWKKYRYIYAIEQFKAYFADEQWVVLGEDVFHHTLDPNYVELKNQCIFNGFGLALVNKNGETRAINTPSRLGLYGKDRKMTDWITNLGLYKTTTEKATAIANLRNKMPDPLTAFLNKIWHPISYYIIKPIKDFFWKFFDQPYQKTGENYKQFTGSFGTQKYLTLFSILILAFFLRKIFKEDMANHLTEEEYWAYLNHKLGRENPEDEPGYVVDDRPMQYNGIQKQYPDRLENDDDDANTIDLSGGSDDDVQTIDLSSDNDISETKESSNTEDENDQGDLNKWVTVAGNTTDKPSTYSTKKTTKDGCAIVSKSKGWLIQDAYFKEGKLANTRLESLKHRGIDAFLVSKTCLDKNGSGYFIFIGEPIAKEKAALAEKVNYQKALKRYGLEKGVLLLRKL